MGGSSSSISMFLAGGFWESPWFMFDRCGVSSCEKMVSSRLVGFPFFRMGDSLSIVEVCFVSSSKRESNFFSSDEVLFCCCMICNCLLNFSCMASWMAMISCLWSS